MRKSQAQFRQKLRKLRFRQNNDFLIKKIRIQRGGLAHFVDWGASSLLQKTFVETLKKTPYCVSLSKRGIDKFLNDGSLLTGSPWIVDLGPCIGHISEIWVLALAIYQNVKGSIK